MKKQPLWSFNLVIEVLLISRLEMFQCIASMQWFQSRNRGSFDFKFAVSVYRIRRHDKSFNLVIEVLLISSCCLAVLVAPPTYCFNLVIEVLLISSPSCQQHRQILAGFQSRNRGSFDFKGKMMLGLTVHSRGFNLVIEVLLISSLDRMS